MTLRRRLLTRRDAAAPPLLRAFFAAVLAMVATVVVISRIDRDWAVFVAIALLVGLLAVMGRALGRHLRDGASPPADPEQQQRQ